MENQITRKTRVILNVEIFNQLKRLHKSKSKLELMEITSLRRNAVNEAIRKIESSEHNDPQFENLYKKSGRKRINKRGLHNEIRNIMGNDNSLTQKGCQQKLSVNLSVSQINRKFKAVGLIRKRLKKRSNVRLTDKNNE